MSVSSEPQEAAVPGWDEFVARLAALQQRPLW